MIEPISLSEDRLRAILAEFKLDLIERITRELARKADMAHVEALEQRLTTVEEAARDARLALTAAQVLEAELDRLAAWKNRIVGALALVSAVAIPASLVVLNELLSR